MHKERTRCYEKESKRNTRGGSDYGPKKKLNSWLATDIAEEQTWESRPWNFPTMRDIRTQNLKKEVKQ